MRRTTILIVLATAMAVAGPIHAGPPTRLSAELDFSFPSGFWTRTCGFPVVETVRGTLHIGLFTEADGSVRELDTFPSFTIELSAPPTGGSFSYPLGPVTFEYPNGVFPGAPSIVTTHGIQRRVPGLPAEAGRTVFTGVVLFVDADGVPVVDFGPPAVEQHGNVNDLTEMIRGACAALAG